VAALAGTEAGLLGSTELAAPLASADDTAAVALGTAGDDAAVDGLEPAEFADDGSTGSDVGTALAVDGSVETAADGWLEAGPLGWEDGSTLD